MQLAAQGFSPGGYLLLVKLGKCIGVKTRVAAVSVRVRLNADKAVMKDGEDLRPFVFFGFDPVIGIAENRLHACRNIGRKRAEVFYGFAVTAGPQPDVAKHFQVQASCEFLRKNIALGLSEPHLGCVHVL